MTSRTEPVETFSLTVRLPDGRAVVEVRGEVDMNTAPELRGVLDSVMERHKHVVLDLAELDFTDASGLAVVAHASAITSGAEGSLTLRSPSSAVLRLLEITGMTDSVRIEPPVAARDHLAAQQSEVDRTESLETAGALSTAPLRSVAALPADVDVVDGALRLVVALAQATVGGADGVSVSLQRHGRLVTVAASDRTISEMDARQYATGEGPCVDASVEGLWFHAESLAQESRWPEFTPLAMELGINSILSSPLLVEERPLGALNIYSRTAAAFGPKDQELAGVFATEASLILRDAGADVSDERQSARLRVALERRRTIAQAQGVVMEREGIGADSAYRLLRHLSRRSNQPFYEWAQDVVASAVRPELRNESGSAEGLRG
jgi:anti-anti-sigma factor